MHVVKKPAWVWIAFSPSLWHRVQLYVVEDYYVAHSEPQHIEDTFALAMTYNSEPKEASVAKIRKYIKDFYKDDISIDKWVGEWYHWSCEYWIW